jgi:tRNA dimethylallyltransferase
MTNFDDRLIKDSANDKGSVPNLLVIAGPTASGKSSLALKIAKQFNGEIIAADSRTVYKRMDIGTAKVTREEQARIPHWGLDLVEPGERFTAGLFKKYADEKIKDIQNRGRLPILVGGSGLYIDSVLYQFEFRGDVRPQERAELEKLTTDQLQAKIKHMGYTVPQNAKNRRHLIRTIESQGQTASKSSELARSTLVVGIMPPLDQLKARIGQRAEVIFQNGVVEETRKLLEDHGEAAITSTGGIVYQICLNVIGGQISQEEAIERFKTADWQYARRQRTWFKRNPDIQWFDSASDAYNFLKSRLST